EKTEPADQDPRGEHADDPARERDPERLDLPVEVRLDPGAAHIVAFHVVDDHPHDPREADDEAHRLEDVHEQREILPFLVVGFGHSRFSRLSCDLPYNLRSAHSSSTRLWTAASIAIG